MSLLDALIVKQDNFEIVRDQIAGILVAEIENQEVTLNGGAADYHLDVYVERANPWSKYLGDNPNRTPIVNIWFDSYSTDENASDTINRQTVTALYNIDCYGYGKSANVSGGGHKAGDKEAALESHRAFRLVRNILMSPINAYLDLRGLVWSRKVRSVNTFQPQQDSVTIQEVVATRLVLAVQFNEFSPDNTYDNLEISAIEIKRADDGRILAQIETDHS